MTSSINSTKTTDHSVVSTCSLGSSVAAVASLRVASASLRATGLSGISAVSPAALVGLPVRERNERPTEAPEAAVAKAQAKAYAFAATGAGSKTTQQHHHMMWAFRGLEPWSDPA
ncbi:hypothetical protein ACIQM4_06255 [Streptomyces sp. NPDC091272]|uniref:hypothetical protein n=1 Tax=Streptomyces sp. NPDC091272 TaxID=3365981 RepID=UPI0037FD965C